MNAIVHWLAHAHLNRLPFTAALWLPPALMACLIPGFVFRMKGVTQFWNWCGVGWAGKVRPTNPRLPQLRKSCE